MRKLKLEELDRITIEEFKSTPKIPVTVILDNIRSGMNVGSFFRTADAFLIEHLILTGITATPPHKEILKTAIGSNNTVNWVYEPNTSDAIRRLKSEGFVIIGIEQTDKSEALQTFAVNTHQRYAIVMGNEVEGISDDVLPLLDHAVEIPQFGTKHSLNVAVCGGIVMWHFAKPYLLR